MCYILTAIKLKENDQVKDSLLNVLQEAQSDHPDGGASLCFSDSKVPAIKRDSYFTRAEIKKDLDGFDVINYHFRTATIGVANLNNTHFWKMGNWAFCHNGGIARFGNQVESDSYNFFKGMFDAGYLKKNNTLKGQEIKDYVNDQSFWGRFLIINLKNKNVYFFGDFQTYLVEKSYLVFTSANTTFENKLDVMGLKFDLPDDLNSLDSSIDGVHMLNFASKQFFRIFETFKTQRQHPAPFVQKETTATAGKEEADNLDRNEVLLSRVMKKPRSQESYIKEFENRLSTFIKKFPGTAEDIVSELEQGLVNEYGRTGTEEELWELWIAPQLEANNQKDFAFREYTDE